MALILRKWASQSCALGNSHCLLISGAFLSKLEKSIILVIYVCFQIYFLIGDHCSTQNIFSVLIKKGQDLLNFLQGVIHTGHLIN